uniref:Uncharacterized protein n=1 Tax=Arundo donax TaxID=35708 RepID=A0A0A9HHF1_ARUDO
MTAGTATAAAARRSHWSARPYSPAT